MPRAFASRPWPLRSRAARRLLVRAPMLISSSLRTALAAVVVVVSLIGNRPVRRRIVPSIGRRSRAISSFLPWPLMKACLLLALISGLTGCAGDSDSSPSTTPLQPSSDGGGMALTCAPSDGEDIKSARFPACTFVEEKACASNEGCGCGCSCQCGVCNCDGGESPPGMCTTDRDCGDSCFGLSCKRGQCVAKQSGAFIGTWKGTLNKPSTIHDVTCESGLKSASGQGPTTGVLEGQMTIEIVGQGNEIVVLLTGERSSGAPLCRLPFLVSGNVATLIAGSACVMPGLPSICPTSDHTPPVAIETFLDGTATLDGGVITLRLRDVFVSPVGSGSECDSPPSGTNQVNIESLRATLQRSSE
jgi:hypothetical protein